MTRYGYHASHEQISPGRLLADVRGAERAGFEAAMCSDHFMPWSARQGHSGFAFAWLGAALATTSLPIGSVNAPGQRYHPAIVAQATATLGEMFPGRYWVALGSGQAMNEHVTGDPWPRKPARQERLEECVGPEHVNAADARRDEDSLLHHITRLAQRYRECPELGWGTFELLDQPHVPVLAHRVTWDEAAMVLLHNLGAHPAVVPLTFEDEEPGTELVDLLQAGRCRLDADRHVELTLDGYGYRWLRITRDGDIRLV